MQRLFLIFWSAVVIVLIGLMSMLYVSLIPHFRDIGNVASLLLYAWMVFGTAAGMAWIGLKIYHAWICRNVVAVGEVVAYRISPTEFEHLSAAHEKAKVIPALPPPREVQEPLPSESWVVLDMHRQGIGFKRIAEATQWTEYEVRKLCNQVDGKSRKSEPSHAET